MEDIVANGLDTVHTPPAIASDMVIFANWQTIEGPVIVPADGSASTDIVLVVVALPHMLVIV